jgi:hypothetical protein
VLGFAPTLGQVRVATFKLFEKIKCKSESGNNGRSWGTLLNSQHFKGKKSMSELQDANYDK